MWISIDEKDSRPLYLQIVQQVKEQVLKRTLKKGDELPSVRELAESLDINLHTVRAAYLKLKEQGLIHLHLGRRATVAGLPQTVEPAAIGEDLGHRLDEVITDALVRGLSPDDIRELVERHLNGREKN